MHRLKSFSWIYLVQDGEEWWAVVNTVINFQVLKLAGYFFIS
jgi:hypothetical protein